MWIIVSCLELLSKQIVTIYEYLFIYYKIEDDGKLNKYIGVELDH